MWKACPECGDIKEFDLERNSRRLCHKCQGVGHQYRLMLAPELLLSAENNAKRGYNDVAQKRRGIALNLVRHAAIMECVRAAREAYGEALRDGLDGNAAWKCARDAMHSLLE